MAELVQEWLPYVLGLLISCGAAAWLKAKLQDMGLVKKLHAEALVGMLADKLVAWAENKVKDAKSGGQKLEMVKGRMEKELAEKGVSATSEELEEAIEAAHRRMLPFPEKKGK